ncbi:acyl-homoserine-lactone synthase [Nitrobacter sp.]|uniref:acyl-homoserine-lactone synthase n=1 Tax=Nitrobacter sp. TaxID=29420 RepID=UPI003F650FF0
MRCNAVFGREADLGGALAIDLMRFRKRLFVDQFGWNLSVAGDCERDQFDNHHAIYCALFCDDVLAGMFRLVRTDNPYLSRVVFPNLAQLGSYPVRLDVWEVSRFGVMHPNLRIASAANHALMIYFALRLDVRALVGVTDVRYERALRHLGINTRRYGHPATVGIDHAGNPIQAVAGEILLSQQSNAKIQYFIDLAERMDIQDASHVFGYQRVSA